MAAVNLQIMVGLGTENLVTRHKLIAWKNKNKTTGQKPHEWVTELGPAVLTSRPALRPAPLSPGSHA